MKRRIFTVITTIILLISMTFPTTVLATSMPTTTITSVKAQNKAFTVKWKKKSSITGYQIQYSTPHHQTAPSRQEIPLLIYPHPI